MVLHGFTIQEKGWEKGFAMLQIWESMMVCFPAQTSGLSFKKGLRFEKCSIFGVDTHY